MEAREKGDILRFSLAQNMHQDGINVRYAGVVLDQVPDDRGERYELNRNTKHIYIYIYMYRADGCEKC